MDIRRVILYAALAWVVFSLWTHWQNDFPKKAVQPTTIVQTEGQDANLLPTVEQPSQGQKALLSPLDSETKPSPTGQQIRVKTDVLDLTIDLNQGDIVKAMLLDYPVSTQEAQTPITLLQDNQQERYVANSGLLTVNQQTIETIDFNYRASKDTYEMKPGEKQLVVTLTGKSAGGIEAHKSFIFTQGSYLIDIQYELENASGTPWKGYLNTQLLRSSPKEDKSSLFHVGSYTGASYAQPGEHRYKKVTFKDMGKTNLDVKAQGGWIAMQQHYFLSAWVPNAQSVNRLYTRAIDDDYTIGALSQPIVLSPSAQEKVSTRLYIGPEKPDVLKAIAPGLDLTVDYGWLWFLSSFLFSLMKAIYSVVGNWGWSIVLVTVLIKLAFYRLSATSYKSMAAMRKLQPKLQALKERFGDDKAKISQATMELYRQEKVNPLGGCLPIIIQIPVFIALYWVLLESVELRQAPFILWINDLAAADPYHILPIIMGATMLIQQRLNPAPPDPMQAKIMMFLPILFTALFWSFPAGLVLYWIVNNSLSILQQWYITRKYSTDSQTKKLASAK